MRLIEDWRTVLRKAWSIRLSLLTSAMISAAGVAAYLPAVRPDLPLWVLFLVPALASVLVPVARLIEQDMKNGH